MPLVFADLLDALEEHTLATIRAKENEGNPDTRNGRFDRELADDRLTYARIFLNNELKKLT